MHTKQQAANQFVQQMAQMQQKAKMAQDQMANKKEQNQQQQMRMNMNNDPNQSARSTQKQEKFEQELAMKKAMREQDNIGQQAGRKIDGVPQNFNQMWEQNNRF